MLFDSNNRNWEQWPDRICPNVVDQMIREPHLLIAGTTGCGKSTLIHAIISALLTRDPQHTELILIDPKQIELGRFCTPHAIRYAYTPRQMLSALEYASAMMDARYNAQRRTGETGWRGLYVIIDELADLMLNQRKEVMPVLQHLLQLGRAANIHVIAATQCPNRRVIPAELVLNFTGRIGMRCLSPIESRQIIGQNGCETLPRYGTFYFANAEGLNIWFGFEPTDPDVLQKKIDFWNEQAGAGHSIRAWFRKHGIA